MTDFKPGITVNSQIQRNLMPTLYNMCIKSRPFQIQISHHLYCINVTARTNECGKTQGRLHIWKIS